MGILGKIANCVTKVTKYMEQTGWKLSMLYSELPSSLGGNPLKTAYYAKKLNLTQKVPEILKRLYNSSLKTIQKKYSILPEYVKSLEDISNEYLQKKSIETQEKIKKYTGIANKEYTSYINHVGSILQMVKGINPQPNVAVATGESAGTGTGADGASVQAQGLNNPNNLGRRA